MQPNNTVTRSGSTLWCSRDTVAVCYGHYFGCYWIRLGKANFWMIHTVNHIVNQTHKLDAFWKKSTIPAYRLQIVPFDSRWCGAIPVDIARHTSSWRESAMHRFVRFLQVKTYRFTM